MQRLRAHSPREDRVGRGHAPGRGTAAHNRGKEGVMSIGHAADREKLVLQHNWLVQLLAKR